MSDEEPNKNAWLQEAINRAKQSALPILVRSFVEGVGDPDEIDDDVTSMVDAIELSLLSLTGDLTEEKLRGALRHVAEPYAASIGAEWTKVADAIIGTLEQLPPDPSTHVLDSWRR